MNISNIAYGSITLLAIVYVVLSLTTENTCLQHGYKSGKVSYTLTGYCIKRVNQTDVVVPLSEVTK